MNVFLIQLLNGVQYGLLLFLVASGLTLIFGIMGVINLAHGSFYMIGAYLALLARQADRQSVARDSARLCIAFAVGLCWSRRSSAVCTSATISYQVLLTFGLILVFEELRSILFGDDVHGVAVPALLDYSVPLTETLVLSGVPAVHLGGLPGVAAAMYLVIHKTRLGMMIRAGAATAKWRASLGINIPLLFALVFAARRGAGRVRRHDRRADVVGLSRHGQSGADHLLRRRRDRRHRLDQRRADRVAADRLRRHLRQGARAGILRHRRLPADGRDPAVAAARACQSNVTRIVANITLPRAALLLVVALLLAAVSARRRDLLRSARRQDHDPGDFRPEPRSPGRPHGTREPWPRRVFRSRRLRARADLAEISRRPTSGSPCRSPSLPRLAALIIGFFVVRTAGVYFIMVTLAFAQMLYSVFHDTKLGGGSDGIYIYIRPELPIAGFKPLDLESPTHFYYFVLIVMVGVYAFLSKVLRCPSAARWRHQGQRAPHALPRLPGTSPTSSAPSCWPARWRDSPVISPPASSASSIRKFSPGTSPAPC